MKQIRILKEYKLGWIFLVLLIILLLPILFTMPILFENRTLIDLLNFSNKGEIGDTIGGITSPFINGLAAILVYIAFREQVITNKQNNEDKANLFVINELKELRADFDKLLNTKRDFEENFENPSVTPLLGQTINIANRYVFLIDFFPKKRNRQTESVVKQYKYQWIFMHRHEFLKIEKILLGFSSNDNLEQKEGIQNCVSVIKSLDKIIEGVLV